MRVEVRQSLKSFKRKTYWLTAFLIVLAGLFVAREALVILFVAFIFASALMPLVDNLSKKIPRWLAVVLPILLLIVLTVCIVIPVTVASFQQLNVFVNKLPLYIDSLSAWIDRLALRYPRYHFLVSIRPDILINQLSWDKLMMFSGVTGATLAFSQGVTQVGLDLLSAGVISIFLLLDRYRIQTYCLRFAPLEKHEQLNALINHLIRSTGGYLNGEMLFMVTFGSLISMGLYWIGLPFAILLGVISGFLTIIPMIGPNIALIPALLLAFITSGWLMVFKVFLLYVVVQVIENNVIGPLIMGKAVGLHPLAIMIAILVGGMMFGMVGIVLAIPVAACLNIILHEFLIHKRQEEIVEKA